MRNPFIMFPNLRAGFKIVAADVRRRTRCAHFAQNIRLVTLAATSEMGSTGDPPVPSGQWPDGTERTLILKTDVRKSLGVFPVPSDGPPLGTGQWHVLPQGVTTVALEFRLRVRELAA